jgi:hypothetical protein
MTDPPTDTVRGYIYRLNCYYNLHGLIEHRCPECGRRFDPADPATFSRTPDPQHLPKLVQRVALAINETVRQATAPDAATLRELALRQRLGRVERENAALRTQLDLLIDLMTQKGVLGTSDAESIRTAVLPSEAEALQHVTDEEESPPGETDQEPSPELDELGRAAAQARRGMQLRD